MREIAWKIPPFDAACDAALSESAGIGLLTARIFRARGLKNPEAVAAFFASGSSPLLDPFGLPDMDKAVRRLRMAVEDKECVAVIGDYDADGVTALHILTDYLESCGIPTLYHIPDRASEGYGVSELAVRRLAREGASLIVTVDTGITAFEPAKIASELGVDMIVTDHHACLSELPDALAVVDPWRDDCPAEYRGLAGVGVAFKLVCALHGDAGEMLSRYADILCVGTVADVMPLTGENRRIVIEGLRKMTENPNPGLAALLDLTGGRSEECTTQTVAFRLAPRINAPGRMTTALDALSLFRADKKTALGAAEELCRQNIARQTVEQGIRREAEEMLAAEGFDPDRDGAIFLTKSDWHTGVLGIVCARLAEKYGCPAILATSDGDKLKASARSVRGVHLHQTLSALSEHIVQFGGHELAAGLTLRREDCDGFRSALRDYVLNLRKEGEFEPCVTADCEVALSELSLAAVRDLSRLAPFGEGNAEPLFALRNVEITDVVPLKEGRHTRLTVSDGGQQLTALFFGRSPEETGLSAGMRADLLFHLQISTYRGNSSVSLILRECRPACGELSDYAALREGTAISPAAAALLQPSRAECAAVWRSLSDGEEPSAVSGISAAKLAVILDIFCEAGLISRGESEISLIARAGKADLTRTPTMTALTNLSGR
ncbi:MAG: single-stranded-DNA-specific exonuclease RecJ [Clostridia bacterium]|nr:single-stranded-DNA-specific exonuclease RecJ [Clostridia bacterium]